EDLKDRSVVELLEEKRPALQERVLQELARRSAPELLAKASVHPTAAAWALTRMDGDDARLAIRGLLAGKDASARQVACVSAGLHRDPQAVPQLVKCLQDAAPQVRREAAAALGRIGDKESVRPLLEALRAGGDRFLEHALVYALIRIADRDDLVAALQDPTP